MTQENHLISMYQSMLRIRRVEEGLAERFQEHSITAPLHLCIGQEAVPVSAPVGAYVFVIPQAAQKAEYDGESYYEANGVRYQKVIAMGEVVYKVVANNA